MLHRDDPKLAISQIVDLMDEFVTKGLAKTWGVSNWTTKRIGEAISYAESNGKVVPVCDSLQMSLATPLRAVWPNTKYMDSDREKWYSNRKVAVFAWECLAKGFLAGTWGDRKNARDELPKALSEREIFRALAKNPTGWRKKQLETAYCTTSNFDRRERAKELAGKKGAAVSQIALAYILAKSDNTFVLVGTTNKDHWLSNVATLKYPLNKDDVEWLETGSVTRKNVPTIEKPLERSAWSIDSWRAYPIKQQPIYPNKNVVKQVNTKL
eukprot:UN24656